MKRAQRAVWTSCSRYLEVYDCTPTYLDKNPLFWTRLDNDFSIPESFEARAARCRHEISSEQDVSYPLLLHSLPVPVPALILLIKKNMAEKFRHWCFTVNNYSENDFTELRNAQPKYKYIVCGKEVGDSGNKHLQGFVSFANPIRVQTLHKWFDNRAHWEVARDPRAAAVYCKKEGDYFEDGISFDQSRSNQGKRNDLEALRDVINSGETDRKKLRQTFPSVCAKFPNFVSQLILDSVPPPKLKAYPLRPWQSELVEILKGPPDSRTIFFIVDRNGNGGKTWFTRYYQEVYGRAITLKPGKKADMVFALMNQLDSKTKIVFLDAPRSKQGEFIQYDFLEELKDGSLLNTKYESRMLNFDHPHVVVMMNEEPDRDKLSRDRYEVIKI